MELLSDEQLIAKYSIGDEEALAVLFQRYLKPIHGFIFSMVKKSDIADDLTQEVFIKVWQGLKRFDAEKTFKPWLYRIARNSTIDSLRKKKEFNISELKVEEQLQIEQLAVSEESSALEMYIKAEEADYVHSQLLSLPMIDRNILTLYFQDDLNFREIGEVLNMSIDTVKSRQRRALIKLKKLIESRTTTL